MILDEAIKTPRLILESLSIAAADGPYFEWMQDPEILQWLDTQFSENEKEALVKFINRMNLDPLILFLGIHSIIDKLHVGNIKLAIDPAHNRGDLGIIIGDKMSWGMGYATEAVTAVCEFAKADLNLDRLFAGCVATNIGSIKAFKKAGFEEEGFLRKHWFNGSERFDVVALGKVLEP